MRTKGEIEAFGTARITGGFWADVLERNRNSTLPHVLKQCEENGHTRNIEIAAGLSGETYSGGPDRDSDLWKTLEGASYELGLSGDPQLEARLDRLIDLAGKAQEKDGYLQSFFSSQAPDKRYTDLHKSHELYCAGHLIEAAVAHHEATGKDTLLSIARRLADHLDTTFGPGKLEAVPGHQETELALVRLYKVTDEMRYLDLARYFVDMRGNRERVEREYSGKPVIESERHPGRNRPPKYRQDHMPAVEQREATGHAVTAGYLYAAMADVAMECDSEEYAFAVKALWNNIVEKKLSITGGVGTHQYHDEGYGDAYLLPNDAYCETCGGIALMLFTHRMGLLTGESKYADVLELILYNHFLASTDLGGTNFFYRNPLVSDGSRKRHPWNAPACCPTNIVRIVPQLARFIYCVSEDALYVDQYATSTASFPLGSVSVKITQKTDYPLDGRIAITVDPEAAHRFALHLRIPGWVGDHPVPGALYSSTTVADDTPTVKVNGEPVEGPIEAGAYCVLDRTWKPGDTVSIDLPMPVTRVYADQRVEACRGLVALMRGPTLYCIEEADVGTDPDAIALSPDAGLSTEYLPDLLGGTTRICETKGPFWAIPYRLWNNRGPGRMSVWVREG